MKKTINRNPKQYPRLYNCTQQNFISVALRAWGYCLTLVSRFAAASGIYTTTYIADQVTKVNEADALPNNAQRMSSRIIAHFDLIYANVSVRKSWKMLKAYITIAYAQPLRNVKLMDAGYEYYRGVGADKWEDTATLITMAKAFMAANLTELTANDNMPATFPDDFDAITTTFTNERTVFMNQKESALEGTTLKDKSIREREEELSVMLLLAKSIFEDEPDNLKKFTFTDLLKEVRGTDAAGLKGLITDGATEMPLQGVLVSNGVDTVTSGSDGKYFLEMPSGSYRISFNLTGYQEVILENRLVKVGMKGRYNAALQPVPMADAISVADNAPTPNDVSTEAPQSQSELTEEDMSEGA
ncbi:MAG: hypothetical protein GC192_02630 [Bacteroidetes bacterium]|nr:hypothetical protein [Bacteroidota bacterium]